MSSERYTGDKYEHYDRKLEAEIQRRIDDRKWTRQQHKSLAYVGTDKASVSVLTQLAQSPH